MNESISTSDTLRRYMGLLWQWGWLLVLGSLLVGGAVYLISSRMTPVYQASTLVMINEAPSTRTLDYTAVMTSERLAKTYAEVMATRPVLEGVLQRLGLSMAVIDLQKSISVTPVRDTQLIRVVVESPNPNLASLIANALVAEFSEQIQADQASRFAASKQNLEAQLVRLDEQIEETNGALAVFEEGGADPAERDRLEATLAQYRQTYASLLQSYEQVRLTEAQTTATVLQKEPAVPPPLPVRPRTALNTILALAVGLLTSIGIILLVEALDDTLRDPEEAERQLGLPVLGLIARHTNGKPISSAQPRSPVAEAFRALRTNLQFTGIDYPLRTLLITSPSPKDGKSTLAANLAVVLAQNGLDVVLVDADLRRPQLHRLLGLPNREGLSGLFLQIRSAENGRVNLGDSLHLTETPGLRVLTTGRLPPNPAELLGTGNMQNILNQVKEASDVVVIDSPPVLVVTDASVIAPRIDGVILVVKPGETKLEACKQAVEQLRRRGANLLGVVLNDVDVKRLRYYYNYKDYYSSYGAKRKEPRALKLISPAKNETGK